MLSDLDIVTLTLQTKKIVSKNEAFDAAQAALPLLKSIVSVGKFPSRNPTVWVVTEGYQHSPAELDTAYKRLITKNSDVNVIELDNNSYVTEVTFGVQLLVVNCKDLSPDQVKDIQCATVKTAYGPVEFQE